MLLFGQELAPAQGTHSSADNAATPTSLYNNLLHRVCEQFLLRCDATVTSDAGMRLRARVRVAVYAVIDNVIIDCLADHARNDHVDVSSVSFDTDGNAVIEGITSEFLHSVSDLTALGEKVQRQVLRGKRSKSMDVNVVYEFHLVKSSKKDAGSKQTASSDNTDEDECISGVFKLVQLANVTSTALGAYLGAFCHSGDSFILKRLFTMEMNCKKVLGTKSITHETCR